MHRTSWRGAFTALVTPFTDDGLRLDEARLAEQIARQAQPGDGETGVNGIVPVGTTGESPTLTDREHRRVVELAVEHGKPLGLQVIAGTGANSTARAVELQRESASLGADAGLSVVPYYNKPTQQGLYTHFMNVADAADIGVILYNIPGRCGVGLEVETIARLAEHPNIVAVKEATGSLDVASEIAIRCPNLAVLAGDDTLALPIASVGGVGAISVVSNLLPGRMRALIAATLEARWDDARVIHQRLFPLAKTLLSLASNPIPVKTAMRLLGRDSGSLRPPLTSLDEVSVRRLDQALNALDLTASLTAADATCRSD